MMRKLLYSFLFFIFLHSASFGQTSIWNNPITINGTGGNPYTTGDVKNANITVSGIRRGTGITGVSGNGVYNANNWSSTNINSNDYFEFILTPSSGYSISLSSFHYLGVIGSGGSPVSNFSVRSSIDNYAAELATTSSGNIILGTSFQNRTTAITFRIYAWGAGSNNRTYGIDSFAFNGWVDCTSATKSNAGPDQSGNGSFTLAANAPAAGTGVWSVASGPNTSSSQFNSTTNRTATFTPTVSGTYFLNWTITNGSGCTSTDQVIVSNCGSNVIRNGDFSSGANDWTFATALGDRVEINQESTYFTATGNNDNTAELDSEASLRQVVTVVPNVPYTLSFLYAKRPGAPTNVAVYVRVIGANYYTSTNYSTNSTTTPQTASFSFTPTDSSIALEFYNPVDATATYGSIIDNIVLVPGSLVMPIATTMPKGTYKTLDACEGVPISLDVENVSASGVTYSWSTTSSGVTFSATNVKSPTITCTGTGVKNATVVVTNAGGCPSSPSTTYVNIKAAPTVYNVTGGGAYCSGTTGVAVGLSNSTSGVTYQLKLDGNNNGNSVSGTGSAISFGSKTIAGTYTVVATNASTNGCSLTMNGSAVITVDPVSVGGSVAGSTAVCSGTNSTTLTLSGHTGSVTKWQSSPSDTFSPVTDVPNSANTSLVVTNLTTTTYYRAVVKSGLCSSANSNTGTITVNPKPATPLISHTDLSCGVVGSIKLENLPAVNWRVYLDNIAGARQYSRQNTETELTISNLPAGTYDFTVEDIATGCRSAVVSAEIIDTGLSTEWNGSGWTQGVPGPNTSVTISSVTPTQPFESMAATSLTICSLTITATAEVRVPTTMTLTVTSGITSNGKLAFESGSSLLQSESAVNTGNISYKRKVSLSRYDVVYWATPLNKSDFYLHDFSPSTLWDKYHYWDANAQQWVMVDNGQKVMKVGEGYSIRAPQYFDLASQQIFEGIFVGTPNNGDFSVTVVPSKMNLIGNPYPSSVDAKKLMDDNKNDLGSLYFWTHTKPPQLIPGTNTFEYLSSDFIVFNGTGSTRVNNEPVGPADEFKGYIGAGQAFFTLTPATATTVKFNNALRRGSSQNTQFYKTAETGKNRLWLNASNSSGVFKQLLIGYIEGATNSIDLGYDAVTMGSNSYADFYTINEGKKLTIQGRALPFDNTEIIPLGFRCNVDAKGDRDFTFSLDHADGFFDTQEVYLEDKVLGKIVDLRKQNYTFTSGTGTYSTRFVLRYTNKTLGTDDFENLENSVLVSVKDKVVKITSSKETIKEVNVYNIGAQLLHSNNKINASEFQITNLNSSDQVLLVQITLENGHTFTKKVVFSNL